MRIMIRIRIRTRIRIRWKTTIRTWIMIRTYYLKAKGHVDTKLQAARLIWPGGMSGAPESAAAPASFSSRGSARMEPLAQQVLLLFYLLLYASISI